MISRILDFAVTRRWLVILLCTGVALLGAWSLQRLPIDAVPDITNKQVMVTTTAMALSPAEIETQVTFRVETALAGIAGLDSTRSLSRNGFSQVTAVFTEATDIYFARQQVSERLADLRSALPAGAEPKLGPISTGLGEITMWTLRFASDAAYVTPQGEKLTGPIERGAYLRTLQDWTIRPVIKTVPGVAGVDSIGGFTKQYHVRLDPMKLTAAGLSTGDLAHAIEANNVSRGASTIDRNGEGIVVRSGGRLGNAEEIAAVVIATRNGVPLRLGDVATIAIGGEVRTGAASANGEELVLGTAMMLIGANSRTVAAAVEARLAELRKTLPAGVVLTTVLNRSDLVEATIQTVVTNLAEGAVLVIVVLLFMLGNLRAAIVTALVIPLAMLVTAFGMLQGKISANLMSLGALDFGLIVDGAVIITDNALRHLAERQAAAGRTLTLTERLVTVRDAAREMIAPSVYGQAIIILVYVPLLTFTGVEGKMFAPMALTVMIALATAFVLSITLVPALLALCLTGRVTEHDNIAVRRLKSGYAPLLARTIARPWPVIGGALALVAVTATIATRLGEEFLPTLDEKTIVLMAIRIPSTSLTQSQTMQLDLEKAIAALPEIAHVFSRTGTADLGTDPMPPGAADTFIIARPTSEWPDPTMSKDALLGKIGAAANDLPGSTYEFTQPIQMRFNELLAGVRGDLAVKVFGDDLAALLRSAEQIAGILRDTRGAVDVKVEQAQGLSVLDITVDKAEIARRGLSVAAAQDVIGTAVGGREAGVVFEGDRAVPIVVRLDDAARGDLDALRDLPVSLPGLTQTIPLGRLAHFSFSDGPNQISRDNGKRRVVVTANVRDHDIASVVSDARARIDSEVKLPVGAWIGWGGQFENLAAAQARLSLVVPACVLLILLLLTGALGSVRDALVVFSAVPLALTGGVLALWLRGMPISISAVVGFIVLSGVAVLNGLVMLTAIRQTIARGVAKRDAIRDGALTRLRPVAMTALVAGFGFVPMALATGTGAEVQRPIATVVIGGIVSATLLTLLVLPALYAVFGQERVEEDEGVTMREAAE